MRGGRQILVQGALVAALLAAAPTPAAHAESALWTLVASPLAATTGVPTTFTLTATNQDPAALDVSNAEIGCVVLDVPTNFVVGGAAVTGSDAGGAWHIDSIVGNRVTTHTDSGGDRLEYLQWVRFTVTATAMITGSPPWSARAFRQADCSGSGALLGVPPLVVVTGPVATPAPPAPPTPVPTPVPTPNPTPQPILPLPSLPPPTSLPLPTSTVSPTNPAVTTATPVPRASAVSPERPSPSPSASENTTPPGRLGPPRAGEAPREPAASGRLSVRIDEGAIRLDVGGLDTLGTVVTYAVPAAAFAVPGVLLILWVGLQTVGALAWIPAVRRLRGTDDAQRPA